MAFRDTKRGGFADVIRCDEPNYLIWKWHPTGVDTGYSNREFAIRTGSILRVKEGEVAVFVYKQKNGKMHDFIVGPYDEKIKTKNFPILSSIIGLWYEGDTPFQAEIFFINLAKVIQIKFAVPYFDVVDPRFLDFTAPVSVRGTITFRIKDYKHFIECHQMIQFDLDTLKNQISDFVYRVVKDCVANAPKTYDIPLIQIETKITAINENAESLLKDKLLDVFGITLTSLDIGALEIDKESESYLELKKVTKEATARKVEAGVSDYEERLRIQRQEEQYAKHIQTKTTNIGAHEADVREKVGVAGAEALGKMGENGVGNVDVGQGGAGFNPVSIAAGMAVGSAIGKNMAETMNTTNVSGNNQTPPPISQDLYYVAIDNKPSGPFNKEALLSMISNGQITKETLLWKQGTPNWEKAISFTEIAAFFPPDLPNK